MVGDFNDRTRNSNAVVKWAETWDAPLKWSTSRSVSDKAFLKSLHSIHAVPACSHNLKGVVCPCGRSTSVQQCLNCNEYFCTTRCAVLKRPTKAELGRGNNETTVSTELAELEEKWECVPGGMYVPCGTSESKRMLKKYSDVAVRCYRGF